MSKEHDAHELTNSASHLHTYSRFGGMILTSSILMYALMYLNTYKWEHVVLSETRLYMTMIMGATMAVVMLSFMWKMHPLRRVNVVIYAASVLVFIVSLWLVRSQSTVEDVSYMRSMIPHHSVAILASERARISDPRVRRLAQQIIESQRKEIAEMKSLIRDIQTKGTPSGTGAQGSAIGKSTLPPQDVDSGQP